MNPFLRILTILFILISFRPAVAQVEVNPDSLFVQAKKLAFEDKNYIEAIKLSKQALQANPDYLDIQVFLGRLYTYAEMPDSARVEFKKALDLKPDYEDTFLAYGSLEYWTKHPEQALVIINEGLAYNQKSEALQLLKARVLAELRRYQEANSTLSALLEANPVNTEARALYGNLGSLISNNKIGVNYDYVYFDKQFDDPWHLTSVEYSRLTGIGPIIGRTSLANRFGNTGTQFELEAYPLLSKTFYAHLNGAYSSSSVFPTYRAGFSLFAALPAAFEVEAGFRMLNFGEPIWTYVGSLSKYYKSFLFTLRSMMTPINSSVSKAWQFNTRFYIGGADDYLTLGLGTGLSPDNPRNNSLFNNGQGYNLKSNSISAAFQHSIKTSNIVVLRASFADQEYRQNTHGNQFEVGIGYMRRF
ncbi:YaiO family outer membrane beta-barrel protein [Daejeonella sp.]|uniref:YaiO family outer membrane beta-barrel protein n=1 Tax=Daejeonella sp. TaxID=2805397 RepID=UPI0030BEC729